MMSDTIINASISNASKDFCKKKRANRSAKLKQCKLDARREQWLSQVKKKEELNGQTIENGPRYKNLEVQNLSTEEIHHDSDCESSPSNSPPSSISGENDSGNNYTGSSSSSGSSFSIGGCCSGSITEEEEGGGGCGDDDGCLDDWEAMADALIGASNDKQGGDPASERETAFESGSATQLHGHGNVNGQAEKLISEGVGLLYRDAVQNRAWRPDDAFRPQSLPNLSKQRSFPANSERLSYHGLSPWVCNKISPCVPTSCPICCEDLDLTDSSFLPCPCGFHLCLFCHKRILEEDGRCPGCRKPYASAPIAKETSRRITMRLARSSSMVSRV